RAGLFDHLLSGNGGEITGLDLGEPPLGFPEPELFRTRVGLGIEARDEPLGEPRSFLRSQLERLNFQVARSVGHGGQTTTGSMNLMSRMQACPRDLAPPRHPAGQNPLVSPNPSPTRSPSEA